MLPVTSDLAITSLRFPSRTMKNSFCSNVVLLLKHPKLSFHRPGDRINEEKETNFNTSDRSIGESRTNCKDNYQKVIVIDASSTLFYTCDTFFNSYIRVRNIEKSFIIR